MEYDNDDDDEGVEIDRPEDDDDPAVADPLAAPIVVAIGVVITRLCTANAPGKFREANFETLIPRPIR